MTWETSYARWRPEFAKVIDPALYSIEWLDTQLLGGFANFIATDKAAIVTEFRWYPSGAKDIHGLIAAGDLADIAGILIPQAEIYAKEHGCVGAIIESREGWAKVLKGQGYQPYQVSVRKVF